MTAQMQTAQEPENPVSRRAFIKGVIATGAAVSTSAYLFRGPAILGQASLPGAGAPSLVARSVASPTRSATTPPPLSATMPGSRLVSPMKSAT